MGMNQRRTWRRCSTCRGVCHWHDEAWVCDTCGDEFYPDHARRFAAPADAVAESFMAGARAARANAFEISSAPADLDVPPPTPNAHEYLAAVGPKERDR